MMLWPNGIMYHHYNLDSVHWITSSITLQLLKVRLRINEDYIFITFSLNPSSICGCNFVGEKSCEQTDGCCGEANERSLADLLF